MDVSENLNTEVLQQSTGMEADPIVTTPEKDDSTPDLATKSGDANSENAVKTEEWKPNFKVKAYDKEFEIPEKFRALINKDNEKDFRDAFEKAYALDVMKEKNAKIRESNEKYQAQIEKEFAPKLQRFEKLSKFINSNDFDSFVESSGIPDLEAKLQSWMLRRLQLKDLPLDQQAMYNEARAAQKRAYELEEENASYKSQFERLSQEEQLKHVNAQLDDLDNYCKQPGVDGVAKSFDQRLGQDGSFKIEVLRRAAALSKQEGRDVSVKEAVDSFVSMLGGTPSAPAAQAAPQEQTPKPTLPNLQGKATSPAIQKIKSLDDLKKISKQAIARASQSTR